MKSEDSKICSEGGYSTAVSVSPIVVSTKSEKLREELRTAVENLKPGERCMSLRDICSAYGVSIYTAKAALNYFVEHGMLEHRQGAGTYRTNPASYAVANVGIVSSHEFDPFTNLYYGSITQSVVHSVHDNGYGMLLLGRTSDVPKRDFVSFLRHRRVIGLVLMGVFDKQFIDLIEKTGFPAVLSESPSCESKLDYLQIESPEDSYAAVEHLIKKGHRKIGFLGYPEGDSIRLQSYLKALKDHGVEPDPQWQLEVKKGDMDCGAVGIKQLLERSPELTAVFCKNDAIAVGAMTCLKTLGVDVPGDLSVMGWDGIGLGQSIVPKLTTVKLALEDAGKTLADMLYARLAEPNLPQRIQRFPCEFIPGATVSDLR